MANPELSQRIQELPEELLGLEREPGIAERLRRIDALKDRARALDPLDGVEDMALPLSAIVLMASEIKPKVSFIPLIILSVMCLILKLPHAQH